MNVKLDTKEKFTVITPEEAILSANMTDALEKLFHSYKEKNVPNLILNFKHVQEIDNSVGELLVNTSADFYQDNFSFVLCEINEDVIAFLEENDMIDSLNSTPTESEAWDIVQMEEIERELLKDFGED
jgi:anti-anti-sigma regulatory factor